MRTHYHTLGVTRKCTKEELIQAWRAAAWKLHPDRGGNAGEFAEASRAYAILRDPKARASYDAAQSLFTDCCALCSGEGVILKQRGFTVKTKIKCTTCGGSGWVPRK